MPPVVSRRFALRVEQPVGQRPAALIQPAKPPAGQREDRQRFVQVNHFHHHRHAVGGDDETVRAAEQRTVGVFLRVGRPLVKHRLGGQIAPQHLHDLRCGASAGGDVGRAAKLIHYPMRNGYQLMCHLAIHNERIGLAPDQ